MSLIRESLANTIFLLLPIAIAACGESTEPLGDQPIVTGQIDGWNRGANYILQASVLSAPANSAALTSAPIDASGNFSITLPNSAMLASYLLQQHIDNQQPSTGCIGQNFQSSPQDFGTAVLTLKAVSGNIKLNLTQGGSPPSTTTIYYIFTDRDVSQMGDLKCTFGSTVIQESVSIQLKQGWNQEISNAMGSSVSVTTGVLPDGLKWTAK